MPKILLTLALIFGINSAVISQSLTWQKSFHLINSDDEGWAVCEADDSNIYVGGLTSNSPMGFVMKLNQFGDTLWSKFLPGYYYVTSMKRTSDGGCIFSTNNSIHRITSNGIILWNVVVPSISKIFLTQDNFILVPGFAAIYKYDLDGNRIWQRDIRGYASFSTAIESPDGNYLFAGRISNKAYMIITDTTSRINQSKLFSSAISTNIYSIIIKNNNFIVFGSKNGLTDSTSKFIMKLNSNLDSLDYHEVYSRILSYNLNLLETGNSIYLFYNDYSYSSNKESFVIAKYDTSFNFIKKAQFEPIVHYVFCNDAIFFPGSNNTRFAISGITAINGISNEDIYVASIDTSLSPLIGIEPISSNVPESFELKQNYPNPFNPSTTIRFSIPPGTNGRNEFTTLKIYDILGREISVPVSETLIPGEYIITWDGSSYPSGVYFYSLSSGEYNITRKLILVK